MNENEETAPSMNGTTLEPVTAEMKNEEITDPDLGRMVGDKPADSGLEGGELPSVPPQGNAEEIGSNDRTIDATTSSENDSERFAKLCFAADEEYVSAKHGTPIMKWEDTSNEHKDLVRQNVESFLIGQPMIGLFGESDFDQARHMLFIATVNTNK